MILKNKKVAIIGAGPVGLTMARLLQQREVDVTVYERDEDAQARIWGGTLDLHKASGQVALQKAGLLDRYFDLAIPMGRIVADHRGNVLASTQPTPENRFDNPEINRNDLRKMLLDSLASGTVVWDRKCTGLEADKGQWQLQFGNGTRATADLVIGANGGLSSVRKWVTDTAVEETGTYIIQGEVLRPEIQCPEFHKLCHTDILMSAYQGHLLVANPRNNGVLTYGIIFKKPNEWADGNGLDFQNPHQIVAFLFGRFAEWDDRYRQLFRATASFWGLPTRKLPVDKPWKPDRQLPITLIGDAAHLMPPFAGQGVNTGLMDAVILADNLTSRTYETPQAAIRDYEQKMAFYAGEAQRESARNELEMRHPDFSYRTFIR